MNSVAVTITLFVFWLLALAVLVTTLLPLTNSPQWWVRAWDFPRVHIAALALFVCLLGFFVLRPTVAVLMVIMVACSVYQGFRIYPYTPLANAEITLLTDARESDRISVLAANVLMHNEKYGLLTSMIGREDPDILFLMETDSKWVNALEHVLAKYDTVMRIPKDNYYGLVFATRLKAKNVDVVYLADDDTPTVLAELTGASGAFAFIGLHPRPPVPGNTTEERDEQIRRAAQIADDKGLPVVAMGDFNDVAWSWTSERFKHHGDFLDPRIGRGLLPSFDAKSRLMRFPIDQLYLTKGLNLVSFGRLEPIGSDHFPMQAVFVVGE